MSSEVVCIRCKERLQYQTGGEVVNNGVPVYCSECFDEMIEESEEDRSHFSDVFLRARDIKKEISSDG